MKVVQPSKALLALVAILGGCAAPIVNINREDQAVGAPLVATVGQTFFAHESMTGEDNYFGSVFNGQAYRIELTVVSATKDRLELLYTEYTKPVAGPYGGYKKEGSWLRKPLFDKPLSFEIAESRVVNYGRYAFEVLGVDGGAVSYRRVR